MPRYATSTRRKKHSLKANGSRLVQIATIHGTFPFRLARLVEGNPFATGLVSGMLLARSLYWVQRLSFDETAFLLREVTGEDAPSADTLWRWCHKEAKRADAVQGHTIAQAQGIAPPLYVACLDPYDKESVEFVVQTDGIGVKAQKPTRERAGQPKIGKVAKRHDTDVLIVPRPDGSEQFVCEGVSDTWSLVEATRAYLNLPYSGQTLSVVALTDGAKSIREDLAGIFGSGVRVILDWYHLAKRVYQQLSLCAHGRKEREGWERVALPLLWRGKVEEVCSFLCGLAVRNGAALADLLGYLKKHGEEIIDYERRQAAGKAIGSGRIEKGVDQVVGRRQKGKGMSWSKVGSRVLAVLKCVELNQRQATTA
jgi:hypothetical protein